MDNSQHFGDALARHLDEPLSEMVIRFVPLDLVIQWRRCGMIADFLADFLAYNFTHKDAVRNVISTVLNELLENAVKFSPEKSRRASLALSCIGESIRIQTNNTSSRAHIDSLTALADRLTTECAELLFVEAIEASAIDDDASGIGLITLKKDYQARIAVELMPTSDTRDDLVDVQVTIEFDVSEIDRE
jgi:hypothetical protein